MLTLKSSPRGLRTFSGGLFYVPCLPVAIASVKPLADKLYEQPRFDGY